MNESRNDAWPKNGAECARVTAHIPQWSKVPIENMPQYERADDGCVGVNRNHVVLEGDPQKKSGNKMNASYLARAPMVPDSCV